MDWAIGVCTPMAHTKLAHIICLAPHSLSVRQLFELCILVSSRTEHIIIVLICTYKGALEITVSQVASLQGRIPVLRGWAGAHGGVHPRSGLHGCHVGTGGPRPAHEVCCCPAGGPGGHVWQGSQVRLALR